MNINEVSRAERLRERSFEDSARVSQNEIEQSHRDEVMQENVVVSKSKVFTEENPLFEKIAKKTESVEKVERRRVVLDSKRAKQKQEKKS